VLFEGNEIQGLEPEVIVKMGISHVPEGREVFPDLSVHKNLMMGAFIRKDSRGVADDLKRVYDYFPVLKEREKQLSYTLSGGEQQMLVIGRAFMSRPKTTTAG